MWEMVAKTPHSSDLALPLFPIFVECFWCLMARYDIPIVWSLNNVGILKLSSL